MNPNRLRRRDFLAASGAGLTGVAGNLSHGFAAEFAAAADANENLITRENRHPGTSEWLLSNPQVTPPDPLWHMYGLRSPWIEGYCSHASVRAGESVKFYVSTKPASRFQLDIYRMGYYGGTGGRLMHRFGSQAGITQPTPEAGTNRAIVCDWQPSIEFTIPADWVSGVYLGKLTEETEGRDSYVIFIVRDDRQANILFQCSDMTWQAYNRWPYQHSLYCDGQRDWHTGDGVDVSLDRPYAKYTQLVDQPLTLGSGEWFLTEFPLAFWAEQQGYDVSYVSNWDTHYDADGLLRAAGLLSVGHDEYWTQPMFDNVQSAIRKGLNVAFLSGNAVFCKLLLKPSPAGVPDRVFERNGRFRPREKTLIGAQSTGPVIGGADWICQKPDHWVFANTGMKAGDGIPGIVGWEFHGAPADIPGLEVVASGATDSRRFPERNPQQENKAGVYTATIYPGPEGNFVFNAATCWWADGLSEPPGYLRSDWYVDRQGPDPRLQQITRNLLDRMGGPA